MTFYNVIDDCSTVENNDNVTSVMTVKSMVALMTVMIVVTLLCYFL
jgi:hypothetical protein